MGGLIRSKLLTTTHQSYRKVANVEKNLDDERDVAFYSAAVGGWIATSLEFDKSKMTLSVAGIGLLVTLMTTGQSFSVCQLALYMAAIISFVITLACVLVIFHRNATHLKKVIDRSETSDRVLATLDYISSTSLFVAVLFSMAIGLTHGLESLSSAEEATTMSDKYENASDIELLRRSFNGIADMAPERVVPEKVVTEDSQSSDNSNTSDTSGAETSDGTKE